MSRAAFRSSGPPAIRQLTGKPTSCWAYQTGLLVVARSRHVASSTGSSGPEAARHVPGHDVERRIENDVHLVLPADGQVLLEERTGSASRAGRRSGPGRRRGAPGRSGRSARVGGSGPAEQVPAAVPDDDSPRLDLDQPLGPRFGAVVEPHTAMVTEAWTSAVAIAGSGRAAARSGVGAAAMRTRPALRGDGVRQHAEQLAESGAGEVAGVVGVVVPVEDRHDQGERLACGEPQRRRPQASPQAVAAVGPVADSTGSRRPAGGRRTVGRPAR